MASRWDYRWCEGSDGHPAAGQWCAIGVVTRLYEKWHPLAVSLYGSGQETVKEKLVDPGKKEKMFGIG